VPTASVLADQREALLEIGLQHWDRALALLERAADTLARSCAWHPYLSPAADLVEVLQRLQEPDRAAAAADVFLSRLGPGSPPMGLARAARMRALLAPAGRADAFFEESARLDAQVGLAFPLARTWLCHAERLRREHRTVQAAALLTRALAVFDRLEALPWSARAKSELAACGRPQAAPSSAPLHALLTAQELQIAVMVSEGLRNREIGSALFLSLRTVEFHLSSVYRKLGVSGRTQLVSQMTSR
jgi:DNA-binding CsgD family transcriptional regulator